MHLTCSSAWSRGYCCNGGFCIRQIPYTVSQEICHFSGVAMQDSEAVRLQWPSIEPKVGSHWCIRIKWALKHMRVFPCRRMGNLPFPDEGCHHLLYPFGIRVQASLLSSGLHCSTEMNKENRIYFHIMERSPLSLLSRIRVWIAGVWPLVSWVICYIVAMSWEWI